MNKWTTPDAEMLDEIINQCRITGFPGLTVLVAARDELKRLTEIIAARDLCHDPRGKIGAREFADGCAAEQRKLFGCAPDADKLAKLAALLLRVCRSASGACPETNR